MIAKSSHRLLLFSALAVVGGSAAVFAVLGWRSRGDARGAVAPVKLADAPYAPVIAEPAPRKNEAWTPPAPQARGREWVYDTFTPPEIFFNARSREFTVKPPVGFEEEPQEAFGLELVSVRPEPFRLQLIGYMGDDGNWRGTFENLESGEVFLAAAGRRVANLSLYIKSLDVAPQAIVVADSMTTRQRVAVAVVHDEKNGRDITLTHRERQFTGTMFAQVAAAGATATREVRVGDAFKLGAATFRIEKVQLAPASLEVTKESPTLPAPDRRTLRPRDGEGDTPTSGSS